MSQPENVFEDDTKPVSDVRISEDQKVQTKRVRKPRERNNQKIQNTNKVEKEDEQVQQVEPVKISPLSSRASSVDGDASTQNKTTKQKKRKPRKKTAGKKPHEDADSLNESAPALEQQATQAKQQLVKKPVRGPEKDINSGKANPTNQVAEMTMKTARPLKKNNSEGVKITEKQGKPVETTNATTFTPSVVPTGTKVKSKPSRVNVNQHDAVPERPSVAKEYRKTGSHAKSMASQRMLYIPEALLDWCQDANSSFAEVTKNTLDISGASRIEYCEERPGRANLLVEGEDMDAVRRACILLETHLDRQIQIHHLHERKKQLSSYLVATQDEMEKGLRVEFPVEEELLGLIIGSGGFNIKLVREKTGVDNIVVDKNDMVVRIVGKNPDAVQEAKKLLELKTVIMTMSPHDLESLTSRPSRFQDSKLREIQSASRAIAIRPVEDAETPTLKIVGNRTAVDMAQVLINTHLDYNKQFQELRLEEQGIQKELRRLDNAFGHRNVQRRPDASRSRKEESSPAPFEDTPTSLPVGNKQQQQRRDNSKERGPTLRDSVRARK